MFFSSLRGFGDKDHQGASPQHDGPGHGRCWIYRQPDGAAQVDAGERVVVLDNLATGFDWAVTPAASLVIGETGDQSRVSPR